MKSAESDIESPIVGYQNWRHLVFVHWRIEPNVLQALIPDGLQIETFDNSAWLGIVPFAMERVRPWWSPPVPGISWFLETNVRTYVRHENGQSGVWFFSLDANHRLAVAVARRFWHLNYQFAKLGLTSRQGTIACHGERPGSKIGYRISADIDSRNQPSVAQAGALDHFLLERYRLFAQRPDGDFLSGMVHHDPYQFLPVQSVQVDQSLTDAMGCPVNSVPDHVVYSPGVDVRVSALMRA